MVEKITEIDVICRPVDKAGDPVVVEVNIREPHGVVYPHWDSEEMVKAFSGFLPEFKIQEVHVSEFLAHGWVKKEYIPNYEGGELPAWKLVREKLNTSDVSQQA